MSTIKKPNLSNLKFFRLLATFSDKEIEGFVVWLKSPWFNKNKTLFHLVSKVSKYHPYYDNKKLTHERLFKQIQPTGKYSNRRFNNILSDAFLAAKKFIVSNNFAKDELLQQERLAEEFQNRHLEDWFLKSVNLSISNYANIQNLELKEHFFLYQMNRMIYQHPTIVSSGLPHSTYVDSMVKNIDLLYVLEKAYIISDTIFRNRILRSEPEDFSVVLENWKRLSSSYDHPAVELYRKRFEYSNDQFVDQYKELKDYFYKHYQSINFKEQKIHYRSILNDATMLAKNNEINLVELLPHYKFGIRSGLIYHKGIFSYQTFASILTVSNTSQDYNFSRDLIEKHGLKISEAHKLEAIIWAKSHTAYYQGFLKESLEGVTSIIFKTSYFQWLSRMLQMQIHFDSFINDTLYQSMLLDYLNAFEKWALRDKDVSKYRLKSNVNFIRATRALAKHFLAANFNPMKIDEVVENYKPLQGINWVRSRAEKIKELKQKK